MRFSRTNARSALSAYLPVILLVTLPAIRCRAQVAVDSTPKPKLSHTNRGLQPALLEEMERGPHTGTVDEAMIGIEVRNANPKGTDIVRHGCGMVLRCDGFVLVPYDLFGLVQAPGGSNPYPQTWIFTLRPGSDKEQRIAMVRRARCFVDERLSPGFAVFRIEADVHAPALRTMLPDTLSEGDSVEVVWRDWDEAAHRFGPIVRKSARLGKRPLVSETPAESGAAKTTPEIRPGFMGFAEPMNGVPAGAVVVDASGMGIGIVAGGGAIAPRTEFASFERLNEITNCVGAEPTPDAAFDSAHPDLHKAEKADAPGSMVSVPGGPVLLPPTVLGDQLDMEGRSVACVAPFMIDEFEVTNQQFLDFWNSLPAKQRERSGARETYLPLGWAPTGEPFPPEIASLPALGVPLAGARAYAKWAGKRLPTPYEWVRAAVGPGGETNMPAWVARYLTDRQETWDAVCKEHLRYLAARPDLRTFQIIERHDNTIQHFPITETLRHLPWLPVVSELKSDALWSIHTLERYADGIVQRWKDPLAVLAVGSRDYDVSPYGAHDMLLNGNELFAPNPLPPVNGRTRWIALDWDGSEEDPAAQSPHFLHIESCFLPTNGISDARTFGGIPWSQRRLARLYLRTVRKRALESPAEPVSIDVLAMAHRVDDTLLLCTTLDRCGFIVRSESVWWCNLALGSPAIRTWNGIGDPNRTSHGVPIEGALFFHRELGRPTPMEGTLLAPPIPSFVERNIPHDMFYILPVGFRCVR